MKIRAKIWKRGTAPSAVLAQVCILGALSGVLPKAAYAGEFCSDLFGFNLSRVSAVMPDTREKGAERGLKPLSHLFTRIRDFKAFLKFALHTPLARAEMMISVSGLTARPDDADRFLHDLRAAGLVFRKTSLRPSQDYLYVEGTADLLLSVLRHPAVDMVVEFREIRPALVFRTFSVARSWNTKELLEIPVGEKIEFLRSSLEALIGAESDSEFRVLIDTDGMFSDDSMAQKFLDDVHGLGLSTNLRSLLAPGGYIFIQGPPDLILSVLRHPAVFEIMTVRRVDRKTGEFSIPKL